MRFSTLSTFTNLYRAAVVGFLFAAAFFLDLFCDIASSCSFSYVSPPTLFHIVAGETSHHRNLAVPTSISAFQRDIPVFDSKRVPIMGSSWSF